MNPVQSRSTQSSRDFLQNSSHRDLTTFVLSALLQSNYQAPVYLFVPPETLSVVAAVIESCIPRIHVKRLTVAMRGADVRKSDARITGFWSDDFGADLPDECYESPNAGYHSIFGRKSDHIQTLLYAEFAVAELAEGRSLVSFLQLCEQCRVKSAEELQDLFALELAPARLESALSSHSHCAVAVRSISGIEPRYPTSIDRSALHLLCEPRSKFGFLFRMDGDQPVEFLSGGLPVPGL